MAMHTVYWIHYPDQDNPLLEGYIGISSDPTARFIQHSRGRGNKRVVSCVKNGAVLTILHVFDSKEEALRKEHEYRPKENIGWNFAAGGGCPPTQKGSSKRHSQQSLSGPDRTPAQIAAAKEHSMRMKGRVSHRKGKSLSEEHAENLKGSRPEFSNYAKELVECPHCHKTGARLVMRRWHGENCKHKSNSA